MKCNMRKEFNNYTCLSKAERSHYIIDHVNMTIHDTLKKSNLCSLTWCTIMVIWLTFTTDWEQKIKEQRKTDIIILVWKYSKVKKIAYVRDQGFIKEQTCLALHIIAYMSKIVNLNYVIVFNLGHLYEMKYKVWLKSKRHELSIYEYIRLF